MWVIYLWNITEYIISIVQFSTTKMCKPMILSKHVERALQGQSLSMKSVFIELNKNIRHEPETVRKQPKTDTKRINYQKETKDNDKSQKTQQQVLFKTNEWTTNWSHTFQSDYSEIDTQYTQHFIRHTTWCLRESGEDFHSHTHTQTILFP